MKKKRDKKIKYTKLKRRKKEEISTLSWGGGLAGFHRLKEKNVGVKI